MAVGTVAVHVALLTLSATVTALLAAYTWRRPEPGTRPFVGLLVVFTVFSGAQLVGMLTLDLQWRLFWENVQWTGTALIPVFWLRFAMEYTGYEWFDRRAVAALSIIPVLTIVFAWTNQWHGLLWTENVLVPVDGLALLEQTFGPWFWVYLTFTYALLAIGSGMLVRLIWISDYLYADQSALLVLGVTVPVVANVLTLAGVTPIRHPALDMTPYAFSITGLAFAYALFRHRLFDFIPATRQLGRHSAIAQLEDGVLVVDADREIIYLNREMAAQLDCEPAAAVGRPIDALLDGSAIQLDSEDALAERSRDGRVYEMRSSPIRDRRDRVIGHTLISQDISIRKDRERQEKRRRTELETLNDLNAVIRGVNSALVSATTRREIEEAVCESLATSPLFQTACAADLPTYRGHADRWTVVDADGDCGPADLPTLREEFLTPASDTAGPVTVPAVSGDDRTTWTVVPLTYGRTLYGGLAVATGRDTASDRERAVLGELGELVGHAINAVENRRLLTAESIVELEFASEDRGAALVQASERLDGRIELLGVVPGATGDTVVYVAVETASVEEARDALESVAVGRVRTIREDEDGGQFQWTVSEDTLLGTLIRHGANVLRATAEAGTGGYVVEAASDADVRALRERIQQAFPDTRLEAKRARNRAIERVDGVPGRAIEDLTRRQQEVLEAAYRAGYFDWPRGSTAEEVAAMLDITAPTLHAHLRKAEHRLFGDLFGDEPPERD